jgi:hypothetical protein
MERFRQMRPQWPAISDISDEEFTAFDSHHRASDYAETAATWKGMAREAGFEQPRAFHRTKPVGARLPISSLID